MKLLILILAFILAHLIYQTSNKSKFYVSVFFAGLLGAFLSVTVLKNVLPKSIFSLIKSLDELSILTCFMYWLFYRPKRYGHNLIIIVLLYALTGILSAAYNNYLSIVTFKGMLLSIKGLIIVILVSNFESEEIDDLKQKVQRTLKIVLPMYVGFAIIDFVVPSIHKSIFNLYMGRRLGLPFMNSIFYHTTENATFAFLIYFYVSYFNVSTNKHFRKLFAFTGFLSFRVKQTVGFLLAFISNGKIKGKNIVLLLVGSVILFSLYRVLLPEHYNEYFNSAGSDNVARVVLTRTSLEIAKDNFPLGTGFGMFAGYISGQYYSPVYYKYGINNVYGLTPEEPYFVSDTFWPMILGESGVLGIGLYLIVFLIVFLKAKHIEEDSSLYSLKRLFVSFTILMLATSIAAPVFVAGYYYAYFTLCGVIYSYDRINQNASLNIEQG